MNRRNFIRAGALAGLSLTFPRLASGRLRCGPFVPPGLQGCEAGIDSRIASVTAASVGGQHASEWCWAACIEMVFRYYGHRVPQERIVAETWGGIVNLPGQPGQILADLNRPWVDDRRRPFRVAGDVFTANQVTAAQDLAQDRPLIIGTMGHAMVLTALSYTRDGYGRGNVTAATVRDPWPGKGRRVLSAREWFSTNFLVRIRVF